jgi:hypothetical protein
MRWLRTLFHDHDKPERIPMRQKVLATFFMVTALLAMQSVFAKDSQGLITLPSPPIPPNVEAWYYSLGSSHAVQSPQRRL